jgi:hypothetical protein
VRQLAVGLIVLLAAAKEAPADGRRAVSLDLRSPAEVVVEIDVEDKTPLDAPFTVTALVLEVDGKPNCQILLLPGSGREHYDALVGPLPPGRHVLEMVGSDLWPADPRIVGTRLTARAATVADPDYDRLRFAPRLVLRADTIGEATDVPLLSYVEEDGVERGRRFRYTVVFSNEDGGTATRALMARWGRATDIELAYEVVVAPDGSLVSEVFQGPDHDLRPFKGRRSGAHPLLLVATLNNVFLDRGRGVALVAPAPIAVRPDAGTRESIMDAHPWAYRVMAKELEREGKLAPGRGQKREMVIDDPRRYLYLEARLRLEGAAVAARATLADGTSRTSHEGDGRLAIERDGWVRTAIRLGAADPPLASVAWECLPRGDARDEARCEIEATRAFRLDDSYRVGPNLLEPAVLRLRGGESGSAKRFP